MIEHRCGIIFVSEFCQSSRFSEYIKIFIPFSNEILLLCVTFPFGNVISMKPERKKKKKCVVIRLIANQYSQLRFFFPFKS